MFQCPVFFIVFCLFLLFFVVVMVCFSLKSKTILCQHWLTLLCSFNLDFYIFCFRKVVLVLFSFMICHLFLTIGKGLLEKQITIFQLLLFLQNKRYHFKRTVYSLLPMFFFSFFFKLLSFTAFFFSHCRL